MNKRFVQKLGLAVSFGITGLTGSAPPSDVRRGSATPSALRKQLGLGPSFGLWPSGTARTGGKAALLSNSHGKAEPCRTSGGGAAARSLSTL